MKFKVRFRPQNMPDYPELSMIIDINDQDIKIAGWLNDTDKERQILEEAAKLIREKLINNDIISVEKIY